jgi:hypothetical protein
MSIATVAAMLWRYAVCAALLVSRPLRAVAENAEPPGSVDGSWRREPQEPPRGLAWETRPATVSAKVGFGAPLGLVGIGFDYSFDPAAAVSAGIGFGPGMSGMSPRTALGMHFRPAMGVRNAWVIQGMYSGGGYQRLYLDLGMGHSSERVRYGMNWAHWLQLGTGWERQAEGGFVIRIVGGFAALLNPDDMTCEVVRSDEPGRSCSGYTSSETIPYFELTLGRAF